MLIIVKVCTLVSLDITQVNLNITIVNITLWLTCLWLVLNDGDGNMIQLKKLVCASGHC